MKIYIECSEESKRVNFCQPKSRRLGFLFIAFFFFIPRPQKQVLQMN